MKKVQDHYFKQAKKEGYRARSVYKLKEIDQKYHIIRKGDLIVDLGAFPGSWSQYLSEKVGHNGTIIAVDLRVLTGLPENVKCVQADVFDVEPLMLTIGSSQPYGIVSDMAPATTGSRNVDHYRSIELCEQGLMLAEAAVLKGGFFLCKVFDGADFPMFRKRCARSFQSVKVVKPKSSRSESMELFLLCMKKRSR